MRDELDVALTVARALERLGIPYFVGGSLASSLQGEPRSTNDVDFVVDLPEARVDAFAEALGPAFEVDVDALKDAARRRGSWNIFHLPLVVKIDSSSWGRPTSTAPRWHGGDASRLQTTERRSS